MATMSGSSSSSSSPLQVCAAASCLTSCTRTGVHNCATAAALLPLCCQPSSPSPTPLPMAVLPAGPTLSTAGSTSSLDAPQQAQQQEARLHWEQSYRGAETCCEVKGLEPNSSYCVKVKAHNAMGSSRWSEVATFQTGPAAPGAPTQLQAAGVCRRCCLARALAPAAAWPLPRAARLAAAAPLLPALGKKGECPFTAPSSTCADWPACTIPRRRRLLRFHRGQLAAAGGGQRRSCQRVRGGVCRGAQRQGAPPASPASAPAPANAS
jgi:hypothetical protein